MNIGGMIRRLGFACGFRIKGDPASKGLKVVDVEAAYEVRRGNAFRGYLENDFQFTEVSR
jgi:hypothetical protein